MPTTPPKKLRSSGGIDRARYPKLAEYIERLPNGLASYPECQSKGSLILTALEGHDTSALGPGLPSEVVEVLRTPPLAGIWTPATTADAIFYTLVDTFYPTPEKVLAWTYDRTIRAANSKLYRAVAVVARPSLLLRVAASLHGLFQRGTELKVTFGPNTATARLTHPPFLHGGLNHLANVAMLEGLLTTAGANNPKCEMTRSEPAHAVYETTWG